MPTFNPKETNAAAYDPAVDDNDADFGGLTPPPLFTTSSNTHSPSWVRLGVILSPPLIPHPPYPSINHTS